MVGSATHSARCFPSRMGQPLVAVEVDLHLQREPGLHANVQQAEVAIDARGPQRSFDESCRGSE
jgi:hypothetical protein